MTFEEWCKDDGMPRLYDKDELRAAWDAAYKQAYSDAYADAAYPEGYVLVPVEPTEKMLNDVSDKSVAEYIYKAMIQAAQETE